MALALPLITSGGRTRQFGGTDALPTVRGYAIQTAQPTAATFNRAVLYDGDRWFKSDTGVEYVYRGGSWYSASGAGVAAWGSITGDITAQTDLTNRFVLKAGDTMTGLLTVPTFRTTGASQFDERVRIGAGSAAPSPASGEWLMLQQLPAAGGGGRIFSHNYGTATYLPMLYQASTHTYEGIILPQTAGPQIQLRNRTSVGGATIWEINNYDNQFRFFNGGDRVAITGGGDILALGAMRSGGVTGNGKVSLVPAENGRTGYLEGRLENGNRLWYVGYAGANQRVQMAVENGSPGWNIIGDLVVSSVIYPGGGPAGYIQGGDFGMYGRVAIYGSAGLQVGAENPGAAGPADMIRSAIVTTGSYGGGYAMRDNAGNGNYYGGMWLNANRMEIGVTAPGRTDITNPLRLYTNGALEVRGSGGNVNDVIIFSNAPTFTLSNTSNGSSRWIHYDGNNIGFLSNNNYSWAMRLDTSDSLYVNGDIIAYASDARLKKNYDQPLDMGKIFQFFRLAKIVEFDWDFEAISKLSPTFSPRHSHEVGGLAQWFQVVAPWMVAEKDGGILTIQWEKSVPYLIAGMKLLLEDYRDRTTH